mmetsp:Transcript_6248/g.13006  ORF Transcript_6248/g.13006 Transcript_6248/m.13006 type:complete len:289 (-) Transcript_6248:135-1001(-)
MRARLFLKLAELDDLFHLRKHLSCYHGRVSSLVRLSHEGGEAAVHSHPSGVYGPGGRLPLLPVDVKHSGVESTVEVYAGALEQLVAIIDLPRHVAVDEEAGVRLQLGPLPQPPGRVGAELHGLLVVALGVVDAVLGVQYGAARFQGGLFLRVVIDALLQVPPTAASKLKHPFPLASGIQAAHAPQYCPGVTLVLGQLAFIKHQGLRPRAKLGQERLLDLNAPEGAVVPSVGARGRRAPASYGLAGHGRASRPGLGVDGGGVSAGLNLHPVVHSPKVVGLLHVECLDRL